MSFKSASETFPKAEFEEVEELTVEFGFEQEHIAATARQHTPPNTDLLREYFKIIVLVLVTVADRARVADWRRWAGRAGANRVAVVSINLAGITGGATEAGGLANTPGVA